MAQRQSEGRTEGHNRCYRCNRTSHVASACPLAEYGLWFCYVCQGERNHKGTDCPNKGSATSQNRFVNSDQHKNNTTHNNTTQFRGNNNFRGRGHTNRGSGIKIRGGGRGNFRGRVSKRNANRGARGGSHNAIAQGARAYVAGMNTRKISTPTQTQITFIADSGATDHIVNKGIILSEFKQSTGEVIRSANKNESANIVIDGKGNLILTRRVHTLWETDFRGHWRVDFWYLKMKPNAPTFIS